MRPSACRHRVRLIAWLALDPADPDSLSLTRAVCVHARVHREAAVAYTEEDPDVAPTRRQLFKPLLTLDQQGWESVLLPLQPLQLALAEEVRISFNSAYASAVKVAELTDSSSDAARRTADFELRVEFAGPEQRFKLSTLFLKMLPEAMQPPRARAHLTVFWSRVVYDRLRLANIPRVCTLLCGPSLSAYSDASFTLSASGAASSDS